MFSIYCTVGNFNMTDKQELYIAGIDFPAAKQLADLLSIMRDLQAVVEQCKRIVSLIESNNQDHILIDSLWSMSLIRYVRGFNTGKKYGLKADELFKNLKGDPIGAHQFYWNMRNKHVAHSVNPYEQIYVGLVLSPRDSEYKKVLGVSTLHGTYLCPDINGIKQLGALAEIALQYVNNIAKQQQADVLETGKKLPIEELYSKAQNIFVAPAPNMAGKTR
jgi:hypothetical protein